MITDFTAKYKAGFSNKETKKDFVKHTPFRFEPALTPEKLNSIGFKRMSYPTPVYPGGDGRGK